MQSSVRYLTQAERVMRLAAKAESEVERQVYREIADGWRRLAAEANRKELRGPVELRSFDPK